ncbi:MULTISPECIES: uroporphyrinogen decarboxylase [unclassified Capnocytophaga]|uniref:uroporphyrinogen decarboxylase n=1 Tax=unclassified Capnocytophaga TaxID=2640652 RepID=UPI000202F4B9|nr:MULTISPECIES: uroporphyrinogen decarboxylase [unclassified Capnocytophaga]EGD34762.1 uroporphyrinogen decarboxylase [Capnocytophaga sp. oral taxon 338 str. F0234]MEB3005144.1 uroporphyrinogen decarboxylase [Capnocytophaga sp. G2]
MIKNDLFLRALKGEITERPPVWMMRQAGRYLPQFRALRDKYDFFTRCRTPELVAEITTQPVEIVGVDAAILFSDILVVPQAMGIEIEMKEQVGPFLPSPIRSAKDIEKVQIPDISHSLGYVLQGIHLTKERLMDEVPLIGFAGAPWTIFCYIVEGKGSKTFDIAKSFCFSNPKLAHSLLQKITNTTILYLKEKVKAGADALQLFDSWGGVLSPEDYQDFSWQYTLQILEALSPTPTIIFAKGCWFALEQMSKSCASALGVDWTCNPQIARRLTGGKKVLQGNLDPAWLLASPEQIRQKTHRMIQAFGKDHYIANLGHGILPNVPVENARAFVEAVKCFKES